jgi:hypothetical protein
VATDGVCRSASQAEADSQPPSGCSSRGQRHCATWMVAPVERPPLVSPLEDGPFRMGRDSALETEGSTLEMAAENGGGRAK